MINFMKVKFEAENCYNGAQNMALDEKMLEDAICSKSDFAHVRFYTWKPMCVSLGRNQKENFNNEKIDAVRRKTGGRALLHHDELTYSIVAPILEKESIIQTYKRTSNCLILGFRQLGINLEYGCDRGSGNAYCMEATSKADISYNGKKFIGSAQYRSRGYFLQHGSILFNLDFELIEKIFGKVDRNKLITLNEIKKGINKKELIEALKYGFEHGFNL